MFSYEGFPLTYEPPDPVVYVTECLNLLQSIESLPFESEFFSHIIITMDSMASWMTRGYW